MADDNIDKALPNVEQQVTLPGEKEIVEAQETIEESLPGEPEVIEQIDIGGPSMVRSSAKNHGGQDGSGWSRSWS